MASRKNKAHSDAFAETKKTIADATDTMREVNAFFSELIDGFNNQGWYIVKPNDGGKRKNPKKPKPTGDAPSKHVGTNKGFQIIKEILENA